MFRISNLLLAIFILTCTANCAIKELYSESDSLIIGKKIHHRVSAGFLLNRVLSDPKDVFRPNRFSMCFEYSLLFKSNWSLGIFYSQQEAIYVNFRNGTGVTEMLQTARNNIIQLQTEYNILPHLKQQNPAHELCLGLGVLYNNLKLRHEVKSFQLTGGTNRNNRDGYEKQELDRSNFGALFRLRYTYQLEERICFSGIIDQKWAPGVSVEGYNYYRELTEENIPISWKEYEVSGTYVSVVMGFIF
ncbi:hypothetical protein GYB22_03320 [bacterium]|nr:hypothetical protein [bacterium]